MSADRQQRPRHGARFRLAWLVVTLTSMLLAPFVAASGASAAKLNGFGDPVARFQAQFGRDSVGCEASSCYGPQVPHSSGKFQFSYVTTARGRVDGFDLALPRGTSYLKAELEIAQLFPTDIQMGSLNVIHHDTDGNACAVYDLQSKTIAKIFGKKAFGNSDGTVGVELARVLPNGATTYTETNLNLALIVPTYLGNNASC